MKTVLLPVKDFKDAKHRLAPALNLEERAGLARAMLADVLDALSAATEPSRIVIYTASENVMRVVRPFGFEVILERHVQGHSAAVNAVLPQLLPCSDRILVIASDLPRLQPHEIDRAFAVDCPAIAIMPSRDGAGTNGVLMTPPRSITLEYGPGSFRRHMDSAASAGMSPVVLNMDGVAFDIDTPEDLRFFLDDPRLESETWRFLKSCK